MGAKSQPKRGTAERRGRSRLDGREGIGALRSTNESGELAPEDPAEGRRCRMNGMIGGNDGRGTGLGDHLNKTAINSGAGEEDAAGRIHDTVPSHGSRATP